MRRSIRISLRATLVQIKSIGEQFSPRLVRGFFFLASVARNYLFNRRHSYGGIGFLSAPRFHLGVIRSLVLFIPTCSRNSDNPHVQCLFESGNLLGTNRLDEARDNPIAAYDPTPHYLPIPLAYDEPF